MIIWITFLVICPFSLIMLKVPNVQSLVLAKENVYEINYKIVRQSYNSWSGALEPPGLPSLRRSRGTRGSWGSQAFRGSWDSWALGDLGAPGLLLGLLGAPRVYQEPQRIKCRWTAKERWAVLQKVILLEIHILDFCIGIKMLAVV